MATGPEKVAQYLSEAHATELALVRTLQAHIGVTPQGDYRRLLERHLRETRQHADRIEKRLGALGEGRNVVQAGTDALQSFVGQVASLSKLPVDLVRGESGEEKLVKNAKDECATEALEIGTYDALEALAREVGDERTAELAARNRADEERMLEDLRAILPTLTKAAVAAEVVEPSYDPSRTGAADAARGAQQDAIAAARAAIERTERALDETRGRVRGGAREALERAEGNLREARDRIDELIGGARSRVTGAVRGAEAAAGAAADTAAEGAQETAREARRGASRTRRAASGSTRRTAKRSQSGARSTRRAAGSGEQPWSGYDGQKVADITKRLSSAQPQTAQKVLDYERANKKRKTIVEAARRKTS
jgi:ferritin-like metal-binding protein YciE